MKYVAALRLVPVDDTTGEADVDATVLRVMAEIEARSPMVAVSAVREAIDQEVTKWLDDQVERN